MILLSDTFRTLNQLPALMSRKLGATSTTWKEPNTTYDNEYSYSPLLAKSQKNKVELRLALSKHTDMDLRQYCVPVQHNNFNINFKDFIPIVPYKCNSQLFSGVNSHR